MGMLEKSGLLRDDWYVAARSCDLRGQKPIRRVVFEQPLVLWRDSNGTPAALLDRCCHRNAPLSKGNAAGDNIQCPYHGWTYDTKGNCVNVPSEGPDSEVGGGKTVPAFLTLERYGLVYVWMGAGAPDKEPFAMPHWDQRGWGHYYMYTEFENDVTNLVENFMDVPHTVFVHKTWFRSARKIAVGMDVERTDNSVLVTYDQAADSIGFANWLLNPKKLPMTHTDRFYMPNVTTVDYIFGENERAFVITSTCTPMSPARTAVYTLISYKFGVLNPLFRLLLPPYTRKVIEQDVWIMKHQGDNLRTFGEADFRSTQADTLHLYIESLREWAAAGGVGTKPSPRKQRREFWI
jgi:phenylpropionate dioxygenase-like ring-hydroxylating dioxygenase large terminal subunit